MFFRHQRTPMHMAAAKGRFENILGYLVGKDAGINIKDNNGVNACYYTINNKLVLLVKLSLNCLISRQWKEYYSLISAV